MQSFIYKSNNKDGLYLYIIRKDDFSDVPEALYKSIGEPVFVMELELTPERKLAREDVSQVIRQLQDKGFFVQMPPTEVQTPEMVQ